MTVEQIREKLAADCAFLEARREQSAQQETLLERQLQQKRAENAYVTGQLSHAKAMLDLIPAPPPPAK